MLDWNARSHLRQVETKLQLCKSWGQTTFWKNKRMKQQPRQH